MKQWSATAISQVFLYAVLFGSLHSATQNSALKNWKHFAGLNELIRHSCQKERELQMEALPRVISTQAQNRKQDPGAPLCPLAPISMMQNWSPSMAVKRTTG